MTYQIFSMRAECRYDLNKFEVEMVDAGYYVVNPTRKKMNLKDGTPEGLDVGEEALEFSTNATEDQVRRVLGKVPDSHVMEQSLRPLPFGANSLDRDHTAPFYDEDGKLHRPKRTP